MKLVFGLSLEEYLHESYNNDRLDINGSSVMHSQPMSSSLMPKKKDILQILLLLQKKRKK